MARLLEEGFVVRNGCAFTFTAKTVVLEGVIECLSGITIDVEKEIVMVEGSGLSAMVQTRTFRYHAWVSGGKNILRYESACGHREFPHKHTYDTLGKGREVSVEDIRDPEKVPVLAEVIREVDAWHQANGHKVK